MCTGRLDPTFVLKALARGADGVMIAGCHPGECHYRVQNYKALRRFQMLKPVAGRAGHRAGALQLVWASAAEGQRLAEEIDRVVEEVRALGPLTGRQRVGEARRPRPRSPRKWAPPRRATASSRRCRHERQGPPGDVLGRLLRRLRHRRPRHRREVLDVAAAFDIVFWPAAMDGKFHDVEEMPDGAIDVCLFNGGIRTSEHEEMAHLLRRKSKVLVAFGSCASEGCIPGLANLEHDREIFDTRLRDGTSTVNPDDVGPQPGGLAAGGRRCTSRSSTLR